MLKNLEVQAVQWQQRIVAKHVLSAEKTAKWANAIQLGYWGSEVAIFAAGILQFFQTHQVGALMSLAALEFPFFLAAQADNNVRQNMASTERNLFEHLPPQTMKSLGRPNK